MLNYTGNCPNWLLPVSDGNIKLSPLLLQPPARGRNSGFFCCQVSPYSMSKNIPCENTSTSRPTGPDPCGTFCSTLIPPGVPFCTPSLQALAARILLQTTCGAGHLQEAHILGFIDAQSWRMQPDPTSGKLLQDISTLGNRIPLGRVMATHWFKHPLPEDTTTPTPPAGGTEAQRHLDRWQENRGCPKPH